MGTTLENVALAPRRERRARALDLADDAARACLHGAGVAPGEVDLLVNCGIYHDRNMGEPALAALIQEDIGANPGHPPVGEHGTFSFDLANGPCGVLNAMEVIDGFLGAGTARRGLVVASDADPGRGLAVDFPFAPFGGAALLGWDRDRPGLAAVRTDTYPEFEGLFQGRVSFEPGRPWRGRVRGRNRLVVEEQSEYQAQALACAGKTVQAFLADQRVGPGDLDLVVTNQPLHAVDELAALLEVPAGRFACPATGGERAHTAGLLVALHAAHADGRWADAGTSLLVATGAGITVGCALYRNR